MTGYGLYQVPTLGLQSQSYLLNQISDNIANVNTGGYKRSTVQFSTLVSKDFKSSSGLDIQSDQGGLQPVTTRMISQQGNLSPTQRNLDLAINGSGFFMVSPTLNLSSKIYFTRDGSMQINTASDQTSSVTADDGNTITVNNGYLADKNGNYVLGFPADQNGQFQASGQPEAMRVDPYAFVDTSKETTGASLSLNLPAAQQPSDTPQETALKVYDSNGNARSINFDFAASPTANQWIVSPSADNATSLTISPGSSFSLTTGGVTNPKLQITGTKVQALNAQGFPNQGTFQGLAKGDDLTISGMANAADNGTFTIASVAADGSYVTLQQPGTPLVDETNTTGATVSSTANVATPITFDSKGQLTSTSPLTVDATWNDGSTSSFTLDISKFTQYATDFNRFSSSQDGYGKANLSSVSFDTAGHVIGKFSDGTERPIYQIPLAFFPNPNGLDASNGQVFSETEQSGSYSLAFANNTDRATFAPSTVELSNVDIQHEFSQMIEAQKAYDFAAQTFKTVDQMTTTARDLKT